jgi:acyl-CoA thioesterase FadM
LTIPRTLVLVPKTEARMYPFFRMAKELFKFRNAAPLGATDTHLSTHLIWPWDLDPWRELNNGRTLTLFDLGRLPLIVRTGLAAGVRGKGWYITVAGTNVRYRRRLTVFTQVTQRSKCIGWDANLEQSFWKGDDCASHMLLRAAVASKAGIVPPAQVMADLGRDAQSPHLPEWVLAWAKADTLRPWPPTR